MPALPAVANTAKVEILGDQHGMPAVNVLHVRKAAAWVAGDMAGLAGVVRTNWVSQFGPRQGGSFTLLGVRCTDLSSLAGEQFQTSNPPSVATGGAYLPANTAVVLTLRTAVRSRSTRGRTFIAAIPSSYMTDSNEISQVAADGYVGAMNAVNTAIGNFFSPAGSTGLAVVSYYSGKGADGRPALRPVPLSTFITGITCNRRLDTQRRRLG